MATNSSKYPVDINLWLRRRDALAQDHWKWSCETWDPTIYAIFHGDSETEKSLECPVCGSRSVYSFFLAIRLSPETRKVGRAVLIGDRFFGCNACESQFMDYGLVPRWMKLEDVYWFVEKARIDVLSKLREWGIDQPQDQ